MLQTDVMYIEKCLATTGQHDSIEWQRIKTALAELGTTPDTGSSKLPPVEDIIHKVVGDRNTTYSTAVTAGINECYRIIKQSIRKSDAIPDKSNVPCLCTISNNTDECIGRYILLRVNENCPYHGRRNGL